MKRLLTTFFCFAVVLSFAQNRTVTLDYLVDYTIPNSRKGMNDTIQIGFSKNGRFIYTNNKDLAKDFSKSVFKNKPQLFDEAEMGIMYDSQDGVLMMCFESGENEMFFRMQISNIIPSSMNTGDEEFSLISENTNEKVELLDRKGTIYSIYPSKDVNDVMSVAFDDTYVVDNNQLFGSVIESILGSMGEGNLAPTDLPNRLILKALSDGETLIEAIRIDTTPKTLNINYSFKISE